MHLGRDRLTRRHMVQRQKRAVRRLDGARTRSVDRNDEKKMLRRATKKSWRRRTCMSSGQRKHGRGRETKANGSETASEMMCDTHHASLPKPPSRYSATQPRMPHSEWKRPMSKITASAASSGSEPSRKSQCRIWRRTPLLRAGRWKEP